MQTGLRVAPACQGMYFSGRGEGRQRVDQRFVIGELFENHFTRFSIPKVSSLSSIPVAGRRTGGDGPLELGAVLLAAVCCLLSAVGSETRPEGKAWHLAGHWAVASGHWCSRASAPLGLPRSVRTQLQY